MLVWCVGSDFGKLFLTALLFDFARRSRSSSAASRRLCVFDCDRRHADTSERRQAIGHEVRRAVELLLLVIRLRFDSSLSLSTMLLVHLIRGASCGYCFRFSTSFRLCQLFVHEFCHCWRLLAFSAGFSSRNTELVCVLEFLKIFLKSQFFKICISSSRWLTCRRGIH